MNNQGPIPHTTHNSRKLYKHNSHRRPRSGSSIVLFTPAVVFAFVGVNYVAATCPTSVASTFHNHLLSLWAANENLNTNSSAPPACLLKWNKLNAQAIKEQSLGLEEARQDWKDAKDVQMFTWRGTVAVWVASCGLRSNTNLVVI